MTCTKFLSFCGFLALIACGAQAQKVEVFGGYQYLRPDVGPNLNGWDAALTGKFNKHLGITADLSGAYGGAGNIETFILGPKLSVALTPSIHLFMPYSAAFGWVGTVRARQDLE